MTKKGPLFSNFESLSELGEFGLIDRLSSLFSDNSKPGVTGIGDDCAVLPYDEKKSLLVTTDMLIEGRHFQLDRIPAKDLGYKSLAVNLSDISAMGGKPDSAFLSIGIPDDTSLQWLEGFFEGIHELCNKFGIRLLGGDTTKSPGPMVINFVILGSSLHDEILWRSAAKHGDRVALLGKIGESGAGLKLLTENQPAALEQYNHLITAHYRPRLFVEEAQFLAKSPSVHAMIDLSDGIRSDANHIARQSGVLIQIELDKLPLSRELREVCRMCSWPAEELALTAGEDYGLLFTIDESERKNVQAAFEKKFGYSFTAIGQVKEGPPKVMMTSEGKEIDLGIEGFDHFKTD